MLTEGWPRLLLGLLCAAGLDPVEAGGGALPEHGGHPVPAHALRGHVLGQPPLGRHAGPPGRRRHHARPQGGWSTSSSLAETACGLSDFGPALPWLTHGSPHWLVSSSFQVLDLIQRLRQWLLAPRARTQAQMNAFFVGTPWHLATMYTGVVKVEGGGGSVGRPARASHTRPVSHPRQRGRLTD